MMLNIIYSCCNAVTWNKITLCKKFPSLVWIIFYRVVGEFLVVLWFLGIQLGLGFNLCFFRWCSTAWLESFVICMSMWQTVEISVILYKLDSLWGSLSSLNSRYNMLSPCSCNTDLLGECWTWPAYVRVQMGKKKKIKTDKPQPPTVPIDKS